MRAPTKHSADPPLVKAFPPPSSEALPIDRKFFWSRSKPRPPFPSFFLLLLPGFEALNLGTGVQPVPNLGLHVNKQSAHSRSHISLSQLPAGPRLGLLQRCMTVIIKRQNNQPSAHRTLHFWDMRWILIRPLFFSFSFPLTPHKILRSFPRRRATHSSMNVHKKKSHNATLFFPPAGTNKLLFCSHSHSESCYSASACSKPRNIHCTNTHTKKLIPLSSKSEWCGASAASTLMLFDHTGLL